ncbi:Uncharacterized protein YP598_4510 (plasmid) [Yersinia pseudotuberculosis]|nr:Uncharacterized protein YP598_4510 [Yersinia pseudotuberculosis]
MFVAVFDSLSNSLPARLQQDSRMIIAIINLCFNSLSTRLMLDNIMAITDQFYVSKTCC